MADDIVTRLREMASDRAFHGTHYDGCDQSHLECAALDACDEIERLRAALLEYGTRSHYECEDSWYSCPKSSGGCCDDRQGDKCNCGADEHNAEVEAIAMQEACRG